MKKAEIYTNGKLLATVLFDKVESNQGALEFYANNVLIAQFVWSKIDGWMTV